MKGSMRCYSKEALEIGREKIISISKSTAAMFGCEAEVEFLLHYLPTINHPVQTEIFTKFVSDLLGDPSKVSGTGLPVPGSEDFSYFLEERPGCFFFLGTGIPGMSLHSSTYNFNDSVIPLGAYIWVKFAEHRLGV